MKYVVLAAALLAVAAFPAQAQSQARPPQGELLFSQTPDTPPAGAKAAAKAKSKKKSEPKGKAGAKAKTGEPKKAGQKKAAPKTKAAAPPPS